VAPNPSSSESAEGLTLAYDEGMLACMAGFHECSRASHTISDSPLGKGLFRYDLGTF
jgi:hypothetical protein